MTCSDPLRHKTCDCDAGEVFRQDVNKLSDSFHMTVRSMTAGTRGTFPKATGVVAFADKQEVDIALVGHISTESWKLSFGDSTGLAIYLSLDQMEKIRTLLDQELAETEKEEGEPRCRCGEILSIRAQLAGSETCSECSADDRADVVREDQWLEEREE